MNKGELTLSPAPSAKFSALGRKPYVSVQHDPADAYNTELLFGMLVNLS